jgi:hypothetical protein
MGPPSYMRSVVNRNVILGRIPAVSSKRLKQTARMYAQSFPLVKTKLNSTFFLEHGK